MFNIYKRWKHNLSRQNIDKVSEYLTSQKEEVNENNVNLINLLKKKREIIITPLAPLAVAEIIEDKFVSKYLPIFPSPLHRTIKLRELLCRERLLCFCRIFVLLLFYRVLPPSLPYFCLYFCIGSIKKQKVPLRGKTPPIRKETRG
jgi:hypothetical protein